MLKGRGNLQTRMSTQKMEPVSNVNKKYFYYLCRQKKRWWHTAEVSQARLHDQNVNARCYPFGSLFTKTQQKIKKFVK